MSRKRYLCIKNFDELQHYKDRNPIWIKLHCSLLDDYEFAQVADETKFHAIGLMLLASRLNNKFPEDEPWLRQKINANSEINLKVLLEINFLEIVSEKKSVKNKSKTESKNKRIARKSNKTQTDLASAAAKTALAQNKTEQKKTEQNTTQQNTKDAPTQKAPDTAETGVVVVCDFSKSSKPSDGENAFKTTATANLSEFSLEDCLRYVRICEERGDPIKNPQGLAVNLFQTGSADTFIRAALYPEKQKEFEREIYGAPREFTGDSCTVCFGAKMADVDGKGFRKCEHCKNEKGKSTGLEPKGENHEDETIHPKRNYAR